MKAPSYLSRIQQNNEYYSSFHNEFKSRTEKRNYCELMHLFLDRLPSKESHILDIGCGYGQHLKKFKESGFKAIGIEPSTYFRKLCQEDSLDVYEGSFEKIPEEINKLKIGGVWSAASLLHVPKADSKNVLQKLYTLLIDKGIMFLTLRIGEGNYWDKYDSMSGSDLKRFIQLYEPDELLENLDEIGFRILYKRIEDSYWGRPAEWISILAEKKMG